MRKVGSLWTLVEMLESKRNHQILLLARRATNLDLRLMLARATLALSEHNLTVPSPNLEVIQAAPEIWQPPKWNTLPEHIKEIKDKGLFQYSSSSHEKPG